MGDEERLDSLQKAYDVFVAERDWEQFHTPKNLALSLSLEAAEVLEIFQWKSDEQSRNLAPPDLENLEDELGDVLLYLLRLSKKFDVDLLACAEKKLVKNAAKYPVEKVKGSAKKYTEYE